MGEVIKAKVIANDAVISTVLGGSLANRAYSPVVDLTETEEGVDIKVTDIDGTKEATIYNGKDYVLTDEDKNEIADLSSYKPEYDDEPTEDSDHLVTSGNIKTALDKKADAEDVPTKVSELENDSGYLTKHQDISGKQDVLTFDDTPTQGSNNPVTSDGIRSAINEKVADVQINGTSIVENSIASIPVAGSDYGVVKVSESLTGVGINDSGVLYVKGANDTEVRRGADNTKPIMPSNQDQAVFYGLAKAAGHDDYDSENEYGTYTEEAKDAIRNMIDAANKNIVSIQNTVPTDNSVKIWVKQADSGMTQVPAYQEMVDGLALKADKTEIPTAVSQLENDAMYLTEHQDISGKADRSEIPTKVSELENDSGYLTEHQDISDKADKSEIPTKVSELENDVNYLTEHQDISGKADKSEIPVNVSELNNDAGYLTEHQDVSDKADRSDIPTKVSELENDSGYLTEHQDISGKQDVLTFDDTPTADSSNPVTSGGVKSAIDSIPVEAGTGTGSVKTKDFEQNETAYTNVSSNVGSFAEGLNTTASGGGAHSEGFNTTASANYTHAEGNSTKATRESSHAEGYATIASGLISHAEGQASIASGMRTHSEGFGTIASGDNQHVQGKYNIEDVNSMYADIIGNGTADNTRSNAATVDWNGNAWYAGKVSAGTEETPASVDNNNDLTTKQYVDNAIANVNTMETHICSSEEYNSETGVPTVESPDPKTFYLVPGGADSNLYIEWVYVNGAWEQFGSATIDLTPYALAEDIPVNVSELNNDAGYLTAHQDISGKQDILAFDDIPTADSLNPVTSDGIKTSLNDKANAITKTISGTSLLFDDAADAPVEDLTITFEPVQSGSGDPSPENVRPISGWKGIHIARSDAQLYDRAVNGIYQGAILTSNGGTNGTSTRIRTGYISVKPGATYTVRTNLPYVYFHAYSTNNQSGYVGNSDHWKSVPAEYTVPSEASYLCIVLTRVTSTSTQVSVVPDDMTYLNLLENGVSSVIDINWKDETGTVYGGTLDAVTGVLTVTYGAITIDEDTVFTGNDSGSTLYIDPVGMKQFTSRPEGMGYCDKIKVVDARPADFSCMFGWYESGRFYDRLYFYNTDTVDGVTDKASAIAYLKSLAPTAVYLLETPLTVQLDPVTVRTILGQDALLTNGGMISLTYKVNTKNYIDDKLSSKIDDVQVDGISVVSNGVANIPIKFAEDYVVQEASISNAVSSVTQQHMAAFYGLAKAAGDTTQSQSDNEVGSYTDEAKGSIQTMLGIDSLIADTETDISSSSKAYSTGDVFILNGKLYKATAAIAIGDAILVGTNCEETNVASSFTNSTSEVFETGSAAGSIKAKDFIDDNGNTISVNSTGTASFATGGGTTASGNYSHAEGNGTKTTGSQSHAEGYYTEAIGHSSHAEGENTKTYGTSAHAEGYYTEASGNYSHAEGAGTVASTDLQHVQGKYNIEDLSGTYADIIGAGTSYNTRANIATVDWNGNAWYAGKVSAGTVDIPASVENDNDLTTKQYVDNASASLENTISELDEKVNSSTTVSNTLTGNPITFDDGADGLPVKELTVSFEPQQDLNGYDNPWPGGGGKNLFDINSATSNSVYTFADGIGTVTAAYSNGGRVIASDNPVVVTSGTTVTISADVYITQDSDDTSTIVSIGIKKIQENGSQTKNNITLSAFSTWERVSSTVTAGGDENWIGIQPQYDGHTVNFKNVQVEIGSTATAFAPYSNICPITGHTGMTVARTGKNLLDPEKTYQESDNVFIFTQTRTSTYKDLFLKAGTYTLNVTSSKDVSIYLAKESESSTADIGDTSGSHTFTLDEDDYVVLWLYSSTGINASYVTSFQLELGSTATAYEPYQEQTRTVDWTDEAGTVYGGSLNVTTGVLTSNYLYQALDPDWGWVRVGASDDYYFAYTNGGMFDSTNWQDIVCNVMPTVPINRTLATNAGICLGVTGNGYHRIHIRPPLSLGITTLEGFKTWLTSIETTIGGNIMIAHKSRTKPTYQLTPQEVTTLLGYNYIYTDGEEATVTYRINNSANYEFNTKADVVTISTITDSDPVIIGIDNHRYMCGEVNTISITPPDSGIIDVIFTSGTTAAILTVPSTVKWPEWFNPSSLSTSATYEINIMDGIYGAVAAWT